MSDSQYHEILNIVKDLENKYTKLQSKCEALEEELHNLQPVKKNITLEQSREINIIKDNSYSEFIDNIEINNEHLHLYYDLTYDDAFIKTIERVVSFMDNNSIPFHSLDKKIMYYENDKWEVWTKTEIENFVYKIHHKVMQQILVWQQEHAVELDHKESTQQWFHGLLRKLTSRKSFSPDKVKKRLISIFNLKNIE
tara:strand:+ start:4646 stop:5233 length:588 start_codon:yes stop_codon:yes gene_type:complete